MACIAVYGGSFNPPHVAHAMVASWLLEGGWADEVWLVPVFRHAFEGQQDKRLAPFAMRLDWCRALAQSLGERVKVCAVEEALSVPSYTIDTLRHLADLHPEHGFRLIIGADVVPQLPRWRSWEEIVAEFAPILVGREGHQLERVPRGVEVGEICFPGVSSTEVRSRLAAGETLEGWVPEVILPLLLAPEAKEWRSSCSTSMAR